MTILFRSGMRPVVKGLRLMNVKYCDVHRIKILRRSSNKKFATWIKTLQLTVENLNKNIVKIAYLMKTSQQKLIKLIIEPLIWCDGGVREIAKGRLLTPELPGFHVYGYQSCKCLICWIKQGITIPSSTKGLTWRVLNSQRLKVI